MNTGSCHPFSRLKTGSDFEDNKDLNKIKIDYGDNKNLNQVKTNYGKDKDDIKIETNHKNNEDNVEIKTNYGNDKKSIFLEVVAHYNLLLLHLRPANVLDLSNETTSMVEFDIMQSSPPVDLMAVGLGYLTSAAN